MNRYSPCAYFFVVRKALPFIIILNIQPPPSASRQLLLIRLQILKENMNKHCCQRNLSLLHRNQLALVEQSHTIESFGPWIQVPSICNLSQINLQNRSCRTGANYERFLQSVKTKRRKACVSPIKSAQKLAVQPELGGLVAERKDQSQTQDLKCRRSERNESSKWKEYSFPQRRCFYDQRKCLNQTTTSTTINYRGFLSQKKTHIKENGHNYLTIIFQNPPNKIKVDNRSFSVSQSQPKRSSRSLKRIKQN